MSKLSAEERKAMRVLNSKNRTNRELARVFGVTEGTVRYHLKKKEGPDGRAGKSFKASKHADVIDAWIRENQPPGKRPLSVETLWRFLQENLGYEGSYKSVLRYVRKHYPVPKIRPHRRVETPPGIQAQVDWGEFKIAIGRDTKTLYAFLMTLCYSRAFALVWAKTQNMVSWLSCHNKAFLTLGGVPYVVRIDNLKTGVAKGAGPNAAINPIYQTYARDLRFVVDPCRPAKPKDKGKTEAKVKLVRYGLRPEAQTFASFEHLTSWTRGAVDSSLKFRTNPLTGESIFESWQKEKTALKAVPGELPAPFDVVVLRKVSRDCLISFEGRKYGVPFDLVGRYVELRGEVDTVRIFSDGIERAAWPRGTKERLLIDQNHYVGPSTAEVVAPTPLGKLTQAQVDLFDIPVERRPLDLYERLLEVKN